MSPGAPNVTTLADGASAAWTTVGDWRCAYDVTYHVSPSKAEFRLEATSQGLHDPPQFTCKYLNIIPPPGPSLECKGSGDGNWVLVPAS